VRVLWSRPLASPPRGISLARERGRLLAWDAEHTLYLFNRAGELEARRPAAAALAGACAADDGDSFAAVGQDGRAWLLAPDLTPRWERSVPRRAVACALSALGDYLAVSDGGGALHVFDRLGRSAWRAANPRPLRYLAFVAERPALVGSADFGLVACFDASGRGLWRDGLVAHVGSLAASGDGETIVLACFTEGLCRYGLERPRPERLPQAAPCRLAAVSYAGDLLLTAGMEERLYLRQRDGAVRDELALDGAPADLALGPLGEYAAVALTDGRLLGLDARLGPAKPAVTGDKR
jgi:hypothetical protein